MRFKIQRVYNKLIEDVYPQIKTFNLEKIQSNNTSHSFDYFITIKSLEELLKLKEILHQDLILLEDNTLVIYDDWWE